MPVCWGQLVTGSMVGAVTDSSGALIAGAKLKAIADTTGAERTGTTGADGQFIFNAMPPGTYTIIVQTEGFKKLEKRNLVVDPNETLAVGQLKLELGNVAEAVTVTAEGETVQSATSDHSGIITSEQVENLTVINRDFAALVSLLPGVVENPGAETQGFSGMATYNVQGSRITGNSIVIDGMPVTQPNGTGTGTFMSMDSVATVRLTVSTYQAEFGRKPGASIQAISKGGSRQFHGTAYWYKRHEMLNANNFFNNRNGIPEAPYRYTTAGFNIGGPIVIPRLFNRDRRRAFFFLSTEELREARPQAIRQLTMPTAAERNGDFSDSRDVNGALIVVKDPVAKTAYPGNIVPQSLINRAGQNYLKLLPLPNFDNLAISGRRYNYQTQESLRIPKNSEVARVDIPLDDKTNMYFRFNRWWEKIQGWAVPANNANWGWLPSTYTNYSRSLVMSGSRILSASTIVEASSSFLIWDERGGYLNKADIARMDRTRNGVDIPQFHPEFNPYHIVPDATFAGVNNPPNTTTEGRFPLGGTNVVYTWNGNLTRTAGAHILKAGFWSEYWDVWKVGSSNFNGQLVFSRNANNPNDSNHPFANALLGNFVSYTESTTRPEFFNNTTGIEWYLQDHWRATRRLTLDLGLRFAWSTPYHNPYRDEAGFVQGFYDPARAVTLIRPVMNGKDRVGQDPLTGRLYPAVDIGAISPAGGDPFNGTVVLQNNPGYPTGLRHNSGIKPAPRFGFAYDPFGKGRTAIRGGWGMFYEVIERSLTNVVNPPLKLDPTIYYGNIADLTSMSGVNFPTATNGFNPNRPLGRVMNYSFGVQQNIGFGTVVDVSYVAALSRHLLQDRNLNSIPLGTDFLPASLDPTTNKPLPAAFLRPYLGYNDIDYREYDGNASYHSLQVTANRRFSRRLQFGGAWTWSKTMDYADTDSANVSTLVDRHVWNYGKAGFDRTHIFKLNWIYDLPRASRWWRNPVARTALDDWQISGIASFISGAPAGVGYSSSTGTDITGSPTDGPRVVVLANPILPKSERSFSHNFPTDVFAPPAVGTFGNAPRDVIRGPGVNNWDLSLFKNFRLPGERFKLQFRGEAYNAFNHTQFSNLDTTARFDAQGNQTNARLSEFTAARPARRIQLALRLNF